MASEHAWCPRIDNLLYVTYPMGHLWGPMIYLHLFFNKVNSLKVDVSKLGSIHQLLDTTKIIYCTIASKILCAKKNLQKLLLSYTLLAIDCNTRRFVVSVHLEISLPKMLRYDGYSSF